MQRKENISLLFKHGALLLIPVTLVFFSYSHPNIGFFVYGQSTSNNSAINTNNSITNSTKPLEPSANPTVGSIIKFNNLPSNSLGKSAIVESNNTLNGYNNNTLLRPNATITNSRESANYLPSSSTENMTGAQQGDGQEIDTGNEGEQALTVSEAQAIKANLVIPDSSPFKSDQCTPVGSIEKFVPNPFMKDLATTRFIVGNCITVTGKVTWTHYINTDGDANFNIKLDKKYSSLLTPINKNSPKLKGALHIEVVCQGKNTSTDPVKKNQCKTPKYDGPNFIKVLPKVGENVQVTGIYVIDVREGGHAELHPVYQIKKALG
ncbi:MAG: hypothetical protein WAL66_07875 [Nitrososphaeraceae archaeon]